MVKNISAAELIQILHDDKDSVELIDVRQESEYKTWHISGSKLIPQKQVGGRLNEIDFSKQVVFLCRSGRRSLNAARVINTRQIIWNLAGGIIEFSKCGGEKYIIR